MKPRVSWVPWCLRSASVIPSWRFFKNGLGAEIRRREQAPSRIAEPAVASSGPEITLEERGQLSLELSVAVVLEAGIGTVGLGCEWGFGSVPEVLDASAS